MLRISNHAWLRLGLFGGGFGIDLDNRAEAGAYLIQLEVPSAAGGRSGAAQLPRCRRSGKLSSVKC